ncbi:rRNA maturation RNase YbeY [candidate division WOR-3 bacterium]|nr:rRNA maturation RNase YbeY [candidate division WOR-3 bacterium]
MRPEIHGTQDGRLRADIRRLCRVVTRDFRPDADVVNMVFVNNEAIRELNRQFLKRDRPTDVISFNSNGPHVPGEPRLLGEVYVSRERAREQAREYGVTYASEIRRLALHGLLHLIGLTHRQMEPLYARYLERL